MSSLFFKEEVTILTALLFTGCFANVNYTCGGYIKNTSPADTGEIYSPGYPGNYPNFAHCVWLIFAPKDYAVQLTIYSGMQGEQRAGYDRDYLEVRSGSSTETLLYYQVNSTESIVVVTSLSRWLWVRFRSDDRITNTGFYSNYTFVSSPGNGGDQSPIHECPGANWLCANQECVYRSYRCDGWNDCGCTDGCDEQGCGGLDEWTDWERLALGIGVGTGVFIIVFVGIGLLDICLKRRAERIYRARVEEQKRREKQKKAKAVTDNFMLTTGASKMSIDVPSINLSASLNSSKSEQSDVKPT